MIIARLKENINGPNFALNTVMKRNGTKFLISIFILFSLGLVNLSFTSERQDRAYIDKDYFSRLVFDEVNKARKTKGVGELTWDNTCAKTALAQAKYCAELGKLTHNQTDPEMKSVKDRYEHFDGDAQTVGENLLTLGIRIPNYSEGDSMTDRVKRRYENAAKFMVKLWLQSPPHKKNLLHSAYTEAGIGMVYTNKFEVYVGQVFIEPR